MRSHCLLPLLLAAFGFVSGCGGGDSGPYVRPTSEAISAHRTALVGRYTGNLGDYRRGARLDLWIEQDATATARISSNSGADEELDGRIDADRRLLLRNATLDVRGAFFGAQHPLDSRRFITLGVRFVGTWSTAARHGTLECWYEGWPQDFAVPSHHTSGHWSALDGGLLALYILGSSSDGYDYSYDYSYGYDNSYDYGGSSGGSGGDSGYAPPPDSGGDSGYTPPPDSGGDSGYTPPPDTGGSDGGDDGGSDSGGDSGGGDPTNDDIVLRGKQAR
ncbi:MAG: hypothetical protein HYU66_17235 [Armatimonadetes bacterium]|nr:hypothetical protein [Armatimonadota bacterium]